MGRNYKFRMVPDPEGAGESFLADGTPTGERFRVEMISEGVTHVDEETARIWYDRLEWHCQGRHGVLRAVPDEMLSTAKEGIGYFLGHGGDFARSNDDGTWDVEFVHMTKVFPPPDRPDGWCGTSVLWPGGGR